MHRLKSMAIKAISILMLLVCVAGLLPNRVYAAGTNIDRQVETIRVGWFEDSYNITGAHGERSGYGYEYQQSVAAYTGWRYEYVTAPWSELLKMVQDGQIDMMSGVSYTDERAEMMLFSELPMGEEKYYLYADTAHTDISAADLQTLNGKRIGLLMGSIQATQFSNWEAEHNLHLEYVYVTGLEDASEKVENREIDCMISTETPKLVELGMSAIVSTGGADIYFVINKNRPDLKDALDSAMRRIASDKPFYADELYQRYLSAVSSAALTNSEQDWLAQHGMIRIGWVNHDPGVSSFNESTMEFSGVLVDYIRFAADCLENQALEFEMYGFDSQAGLLQALKDGQIDMIFHFSQNPYVAEENGLILSNTVFSSRLAAVTAQSYFDENAANTVAMDKNDLLLKWSISYAYPSWSIIEYDSFAAAEKAVRAGQADCLIANSEQLLNYIEDTKLFSVYLTQPDNSSFAVNRSDTVLMSILNKTLQTISSSTLTAALSMYNNALKKTTALDFIKDNLLVISLVVLFFFLMILLSLQKSRSAEAKARKAAAESLELNHQLQSSQQELQAALARAESASSAKTTFLSNMSHDIRTPMNAIVGITNLMQHEPGLTDRLQNYISKVQLSSQHLLSLINDVLDMSKIESSEVSLNDEPVSLAEVVGQVDSIIRSQTTERGQRFQILVHEIAHEFVITDGVRLRQLLINLLSNATKYTPSGGDIRFDLAELPCDKPEYATYQICVTDNGYGMEPEFVQHIFEPFTRAENSTTNKVQGTGLGMAIAKSIVDLVGGEIGVESEPSKGSKFTVTLTLKIDREAELEADVHSALLVSGDEVLTRNVAASMHELHVDFHTTETISAAETLLSMQPVEVILLGGQLYAPALANTVRALRKAAKQDVLIYCLDYAQPEQFEHALADSGIDGLIPRPFFMSNLVHAVDQARGIAPQDSGSSSILNGLRFLCAEDNELNAEILNAILTMEGASCTICQNGKELVDAFAHVQPGDYDAILMDVQMPVMNGLDATRAIRAGSNPLGKTIPILAMTANAFSEDIQNSIAAGMNAHISKPIDIKVLEWEMSKFVTPPPSPQ